MVMPTMARRSGAKNASAQAIARVDSIQTGACLPKSSQRLRRRTTCPCCVAGLSEATGLGSRASRDLAARRCRSTEEARRIYGVAPPRHDDDFYRAVHRQLDAVVPGAGPLRERMDSFKKKFIVPRDRIRSVLDPALEACRSTTLRHIAMPDGEKFRLELVTDKPWGAYNWFQGNYQSLIEVNVSLPFYVGQAARLMCHEGYPGHHVLNSLLEQKLVRERGWIEYTIYPLYSSESLLAEGTADFGLGMVFPADTRWQWERDHRYPIVGIDPALAEVGHRVNELNRALGYAARTAPGT